MVNCGDDSALGISLVIIWVALPSRSYESSVQYSHVIREYSHVIAELAYPLDF
jgi:hypothetical protein